MYAFDSMEACHEANRRYGWDISSVVPFEVTVDALWELLVDGQLQRADRKA